MRKAFVQVDKQGNVISLARPLPISFKGQGKFNELSNSQLAKYGWHETDIDSFQGQIGSFEFNKNFKLIMTEAVHQVFKTKYLNSMKPGVWTAIQEGIKHNEYVYKFSYHHQLQIQNACLIGCNVTCYKDGIKQIVYLESHLAQEILRKQINNMDSLKAEYNFYCEKMKKGFKTPREYSDLYRTFRSAMSNER